MVVAGGWFEMFIHHVRVARRAQTSRQSRRARLCRERMAGTHGRRCCRPVQNYRRRVMDAKLGYVDVPMGFSHLCIIRLPANPLKVPIPIIKINCFHRPSAINQNLVRPVSVCSLLYSCRQYGRNSSMG